MAERDLFEAGFATALGRYADEVPVEVDPQAVARSIAAAEARRTGWRAIVAPWARQAPAVRYALVLAAIVALAVAFAILAQRLAPAPVDEILSGRMRCPATPWIGSAEPVTLACTMDVGALGGTAAARLDLEPIEGIDSLGQWAGSIRVGPAGTGWTGRIVLFVAPVGIIAGDARLAGEGPQAGRTTGLHLLSDDGLTWGVVGSAVADR